MSDDFKGPLRKRSSARVRFLRWFIVAAIMCAIGVWNSSDSGKRKSVLRLIVRTLSRVFVVVGPGPGVMPKPAPGLKAHEHYDHSPSPSRPCERSKQRETLFTLKANEGPGYLPVLPAAN